MRPKSLTEIIDRGTLWQPLHFLPVVNSRGSKRPPFPPQNSLVKTSPDTPVFGLVLPFGLAFFSLLASADSPAIFVAREFSSVLAGLADLPFFAADFPLNWVRSCRRLASPAVACRRLAGRLRRLTFEFELLSLSRRHFDQLREDNHPLVPFLLRRARQIKGFVFSFCVSGFVSLCHHLHRGMCQKPSEHCTCWSRRTSSP